MWLRTRGTRGMGPLTQLWGFGSPMGLGPTELNPRSRGTLIIPTSGKSETILESSKIFDFFGLVLKPHPELLRADPWH